MSREGKGGSRQGKGITSGNMDIGQEKSWKNPLGPASMSEINGIIAEARTKEPFPIGSHEGEYFDITSTGAIEEARHNKSSTRESATCRTDRKPRHMDQRRA